MMQKRIPTKLHGFLDYLFAILFFFTPTIFHFQHGKGMAIIVPMLVGLIIFFYSLLSKYELGILPLFNMTIHKILDYAAVLFMLFSPFIFGYVSSSVQLWLPTLVGAFIYFCVILFSSYPAHALDEVVE